MDVKVKERLHILVSNHEYVVGPGTTGIERNRVVFFYDNTRTSAVGFSRDYCLENPQTFQVSRTLSDKDVPLKDVLRVVDESGLSPVDIINLYERLKSL